MMLHEFIIVTTQPVANMPPIVSSDARTRTMVNPLSRTSFIIRPRFGQDLRVRSAAKCGGTFVCRCCGALAAGGAPLNDEGTPPVALSVSDRD